MTQDERIVQTNSIIALQNQIIKLKQELEAMWEHIRNLEKKLWVSQEQKDIHYHKAQYQDDYPFGN